MNYLYYRLWQSLKAVPTNNMPATSAMFLISICLYINILTLLFFLNEFVRIKLLYLEKDRLVLISCFLGLCMYVINYFFLYKRRDLIANKHRNETQQMKLIGTLCLYFIGTFILVYEISKT